jgi:hypothetical protein
MKMIFTKDEVRVFFKTLENVSKLADSITIESGITELPFPSGNGGMIIQTESEIDFSCNELKFHMKMMKPFIGQFREETYTWEDKGDYITIFLDDMDYSIPKRESNVTGAKMIDLLYNEPIGTSRVNKSKLSTFLTTVKTAKDKLNNLSIQVDDDFNWHKATLLFIDGFQTTIQFDKNVVPTKKFSNFNFFDNRLKTANTKSSKDSNEPEIVEFQVLEHIEADLVLLVLKQDGIEWFQEFKLLPVDDDEDFDGGLI